MRSPPQGDTAGSPDSKTTTSPSPDERAIVMRPTAGNDLMLRRDSERVYDDFTGFSGTGSAKSTGRAGR